jgi:hypothetical protein
MRLIAVQFSLVSTQHLLLDPFILFNINTRSSPNRHVHKKYRVKLQFRIFWVVALCSLAGEDRRFGGAYCLHHQGGGYSHSVTFQKTTAEFLANTLLGSRQENKRENGERKRKRQMSSRKDAPFSKYRDNIYKMLTEN